MERLSVETLNERGFLARGVADKVREYAGKERPEVAFVQDALPFVGGAERVLEAMIELFPEAPIYTLAYNRAAFRHTLFARRNVYPSFIDRLPLAQKYHRYYLPLYPLAIERINLNEFDLIISSSYAVAHGARTRPGQIHICYMYTPMRYAWHYYDAYFGEKGLGRGIKNWPLKAFLNYFRRWDRKASGGVNIYLAASRCVADRIREAYRRPAMVVYPPVNTHAFQPGDRREDFYLTVSRLEPHKQASLVVEAFNRLGLPLVIAGDGSESGKLSSLAGPNIQILGWQTDEEVQSLMGRAKAFIHAAEEDFGIALVEAQAAGCPVIAYGKGGAQETVIHGKTGFLFQDQTVESLTAAVRQFEKVSHSFYIDDLRKNAMRFSKERFQHQFERILRNAWEQPGLLSVQEGKHGNCRQR